MYIHLNLMWNFSDLGMLLLQRHVMNFPHVLPNLLTASDFIFALLHTILKQ